MFDWVSAPLDAAGEIITDALRSICFAIDNIVYSFIPRLYSLIVSLANVDLYTNNEAISTLMNRVYILIGIFMLFKLAFSIIQYIVDPNSFSDKTKGFTNLVKRVLIALVLLILTPWLFGKMYELQGIVLTSNIIPNLILGTKDDGVSSLETASVDVQFLVFGPFFTINPVGELSSCKPTTEFPLANVLGSTDMALADDGDCLDAFAKAMDSDDSVKASNATINLFFRDDSPAENRSFGALGSLLRMKVNSGSETAINYLFIASTICGGYLVFLLLSFCIDIAARAIKLMFLQILSPIAFITSIDPTSSSGNDKLKDWGKECLTTFLSLFLRLAVLYLVIQMVKVITAKMFSESIYYEEFKAKSSFAMNIFVYIFLVLGSFQVAKKVPQLLEKALGIKMSGELNLNPFKNGFVGAAAGLGLAGAGMLASNSIAAIDKGRKGIQQFVKDGGLSQFSGDDAKEYFSHHIGANWRAFNTSNSFKEFRDKVRENRQIRRGTAFGKTLRAWGQIGSTGAGIFTGAASGAARGAASSYGKSGKSIFSASGTSIAKASDARNDRDKRSNSRFEGKYSTGQAAVDAVYNFAHVKNKDHGAGLAGEQIKTKQLDLKNLESQLRRANELVTENRSGSNNQTNDILQGYASAEDKQEWLNNNLRVIQSNYFTDEERAYIMNSISVMDLTDQFRSTEKEIKELEDMANQVPNFGGDKK